MASTLEERLDNLVVRLTRIMDAAEEKVAALKEQGVDPAVVADVRDGFARIARPALDKLDADVDALDDLHDNLSRLDASLDVAEDALRRKLRERIGAYAGGRDG